MSTVDLAPGPSTASSSVSQPDGGHFLNRIPLPGGMRNMILSVYDGARNALYGISTDPTPSTGTPEEPIHLHPLLVTNEQVPSPPKPAHLPSLPVTDEQVPNNDQAPEDTLGQPPLDHNSTFASQGDDLEAGGGDESNGARHNSNRTSLCVTVLIVGVLFLVVVPGLALGFATRQVQWGIALSGSVGTVVGVFAGLGCHYNRRT